MALRMILSSSGGSSGRTGVAGLWVSAARLRELLTRYCRQMLAARSPSRKAQGQRKTDQSAHPASRAVLALGKDKRACPEMLRLRWIGTAGYLLRSPKRALLPGERPNYPGI